MPRNIAHRRQHAHWYIVHGARCTEHGTWTANVGKRRDDHPEEAEAEAEAEAEEG